MFTKDSFSVELLWSPESCRASQVNMEMGLLDRRRGDAIVQAATEVRAPSTCCVKLPYLGLPLCVSVQGQALACWPPSQFKRAE